MKVYSTGGYGTRTLKQKRWLHGYLDTGNETEASELAGYTPGSLGGEGKRSILHSIGHQNKLKLAKEIEIAEQREGLTWLTPEYVLSSINRLAIADTTPVRSKIVALELLGKSLALFTDKVETHNKIIGLIGELTNEWRENADNIRVNTPPVLQDTMYDRRNAENTDKISMNQDTPPQLPLIPSTRGDEGQDEATHEEGGEQGKENEIGGKEAIVEGVDEEKK